MPKIIENLKERLIDEARRQVEEDGYAAMTIRSVAKGCGVGIGTVYNYFPSKDTLVATFMLEDWQMCIRTINAAGAFGLMSYLPFGGTSEIRDLCLSVEKSTSSINKLSLIRNSTFIVPLLIVMKVAM